MSGVPGVGKSAIADALAVRISALVVSVDELEAAMLRSGLEQSFETGLAAYNAGAAIAAHQLRLGLAVIADAANYLEVGRQIWCSAAEAAGADIRAVEVVCTDEGLHRARLAARKRGLEPFPEPTWADVVRQRNETEAWSRDRLVLDSVAEVAANVERALAYLA
jgi:predicted kinase